MLPIQELILKTLKGRVFFVHLEKWNETHFDCKLAAINLGPQLPADAIFGPFSKGQTALEAYERLIAELRVRLENHDPSDSISTIDNPCNTEFLTASDQKNIVGLAVEVRVNGLAC